MRPTVRPLLAAACFGLTGAAALYAQFEGGERGVPPIDSASDYEVGGVDVDVVGPNSETARLAGWRIAQRKGWRMLWARSNGLPETAAPGLTDAELDGIVAGIAIEEERIGARRYIARLGVLFDRARAGALLGEQGQGKRSAPMLVLPVMVSGGTEQVFEQRTEWQRAWARFRSGGSPIDYVRAVGSGADPLVLNAGQARRFAPARWRTILDQYGASDVVMPQVALERQWPGGPVIAHFVALHGLARDEIARFTLVARDSDALPRTLDEGVRRIDLAYAQALAEGRLGVDKSLTVEAPPPEVEEPEADGDALGDVVGAALAGAASTFVLQVDTPSGAALAQAEAAIRAIPGVRSVVTDSMALGGISTMRVAFDGPAPAFREGLVRQRYAVEDGGGGLRIRRADAPAADQ